MKKKRGSLEGQVPDPAQLIGDWPVVDINMGGILIPCLVDTTIRESFFEQHFKSKGSLLIECHWLRLKAANGLTIPYKGYMELDITVLG